MSATYRTVTSVCTPSHPARSRVLHALRATIPGVSQSEVEARPPDAPEPVRRPPDRHADAALAAWLTRHLVLVGMGLVALQLAFRCWALAGSWFYFDDIAFMSRATTQPLDASYLLESYGGHLMPGGFLVTWLLAKVAVFSWGPWAALLLVLQAAAGLGMLRLLVSLFGRRPLVLALLAGYLATVFTLSAGIWFAAGINQLPMQVALVFGLHAHVEHLRHRRVRSLVVCLLWTAFGLVFYEKTLLLFGVYALVTLGWFSHGRTPERLRHVWDTYRAALLSYTAVGGLYLVAYVHWGLDFSPASSNSVPLSPLAYDLLGVALAPGLIGGPFRWQPLAVGSFADPAQATMLVSWLLVIGVGVYAYRTRTRTKRAWSLLGFTLFCNLVLLASARANVVGPDIAREYRYQTESAAMFVLGVGLAFLPVLGATEAAEHREGVLPAFDGARLVAAVTVAVTVAATYSSVRYVELWQDRNPSRAYVDEVEHQLRTAPEQPVPLVDAGIPQTLLWAYRHPENYYSHVFRYLDDHTSFPADAVDDLFILDDSGQLVPVTVPPTRSDVETGGCGYELSGDSTEVPLDGPVFGDGWWIQVDYEATSATEVQVVAGDDVHRLSLPAGTHRAFLTAEGQFDSVVLSGYDAASHVCLSSLTLGLPEAAQEAR
jgi:hypothetical protein